MSQSSVYPPTLGGLNDYFITVVPYVTTNATRLGIGPANLTTLNSLFNHPIVPPATSQPLSSMGWIQLWILYADKKDSRTTAVKVELRARNITLQHLLTSIYNDIAGSKWTKMDRDITGRKGPALGHKPQHTEIETIAPPSPTLELGGKNQLVLRIPQAGGQKGATKEKGGKPKGVKLYEFHYSVYTPLVPASGSIPATGTADPKSISDCNQSQIVTRTPYRMNFDPSKAGMTCGGFVQTIEKPNKAGAISILIKAIIPG
jgi:hypothetical protein